jgi:hypothetical protein
MIIDIGNIIISKLTDLPFVDKYAGVVKPVTYSNEGAEGKLIKKTVPISCNITSQEGAAGRYMDLCPDSSKKSVLYLEDKYVRFVKRDGDKYTFQASFDLVCWLNLPKLGLEQCSVSAKAILSIITAFRNIPSNEGIFHQLLITPLGQDSKARNPFAKWSYDEEVTQFLLYPYDHFLVPIQVDFVVNRKCVEEFQINDPIGCEPLHSSGCEETPVPSPYITCTTLSQCQSIIDILERLDALESEDPGSSFDCSELAGCQIITDINDRISTIEEQLEESGSVMFQTAVQWAADNTVYSERILVTSDENYTGTTFKKYKIADGATTWSNLPYAPLGVYETDGLSAYYGIGHKNGDIELVSYIDNTIVFGASAWFGTRSNHDLLIFTNDGSAQAIFRRNEKTLALPNATASKLLRLNGNKDIVSCSIDENEVATIDLVDQKIAEAVTMIVAGSPNALDTLLELSAALGNDANFATNVTNALAGKEYISNKSTSVVADQASNTKYPSVKSVFDWATGIFQTISGMTADVLAILSANAAAARAGLGLVIGTDVASQNDLRFKELAASVMVGQSGTVTLNLNDPAFDISVTGNFTLDFSNASASVNVFTRHLIYIRQDATGGRTGSLTAGKFRGTLVINQDANAVTIVEVVYSSATGRMSILNCTTDTATN